MLLALPSNFSSHPLALNFYLKENSTYLGNPPTSFLWLRISLKWCLLESFNLMPLFSPLLTLREIISMATYLLECFLFGGAFVSQIYILCEANILETEYNHNFGEKEPRTRAIMLSMEMGQVIVLLKPLIRVQLYGEKYCCVLLHLWWYDQECA